MKTERSNWEKNKGVIDLIAAVVGGFGGAIIFPGEKFLALFLASIVGSVISLLLVNICYFNQIVYPNLKEFRDHQCLLEGVTSFLQEAKLIDSDKRAVAMDFVVSSLKCITFKGFLEVDLHFRDFLDYIERLAAKTKRNNAGISIGSIFGTSPVRPKRLANDVAAKRYLKFILSPVKKAVRISVLRDNSTRGNRAGGARQFTNSHPKACVPNK